MVDSPFDILPPPQCAITININDVLRRLILPLCSLLPASHCVHFLLSVHLPSSNCASSPSESFIVSLRTACARSASLPTSQIPHRQHPELDHSSLLSSTSHLDRGHFDLFFHPIPSPSRLRLHPCPRTISLSELIFSHSVYIPCPPPARSRSRTCRSRSLVCMCAVPARCPSSRLPVHKYLDTSTSECHIPVLPFFRRARRCAIA
ncbi:hypothetical protein BC628DRAFT_1014508 [Trametes gibbosa]|nr:hypothetical protein BC628DRAFT_1014508 [Trametes gibbosa]